MDSILLAFRCLGLWGGLQHTRRFALPRGVVAQSKRRRRVWVIDTGRIVMVRESRLTGVSSGKRQFVALGVRVRSVPRRVGSELRDINKAMRTASSMREEATGKVSCSRRRQAMSLLTQVLGRA